MDAYTQTGNTQKALDTARKVLQMDPTDMRALALSAFVLKTQAAQKTNPAEAQPLLDEAAADAQKGLSAPAPQGADSTNYDKMKAAVTPLFEGAIAADDLGKKDYAAAIKDFKAELQAMPEQQTTTGPGIEDTYQLGTAYTQQTPQDLVNAVWYLARAAAYAPEPFKDEIQKAAQYWYKKYHGGTDGFDQVQAQAKASLNPPSGFSITPAPPPPSPQQLAHTAVTTTPDLKTMALTDKEFVLANGTPDDASKVWDTMKGLTTKVPGKVVAATPDLGTAGRVRRCSAVEQGGLHHQHEDSAADPADHRFHGELHRDVRLLHAEPADDHHEGRGSIRDGEAACCSSHPSPRSAVAIAPQKRGASIRMPLFFCVSSASYSPSIK